jgi:hypothetical protein
MTILPITLFGSLSLLYYFAYGIKDAITRPLILAGLWKQQSSMEQIRGQDPTGMKRARALREARAAERVQRE